MSTHHEKVYVGIDVSKKTLDVFACGQSARFARDDSGLASLIYWIKEACHDHRIQVIIEPTGGYELLVLEALSAHGIEWARTHPRRVRQYAKATGQEAKTDKIDARLLAQFGEQFTPKPQTLASDAQRELSALMTRYEQLKGMCTMEKTHAEHVTDPWLKKKLQSSIRRFEKEIELIVERAEKLLEQNPAMKAKRDCMTEVKGIGTVTALILLAKMPELGTLNRGEAASLAGLAPVTRQSGQWKGRSFLAHGRESATKALYMAALSAAHFNEHLKDFYQRLRSAGKPPKLALCAVARKLIIALNSMLKKIPQNT
jgi:transposase